MNNVTRAAIKADSAIPSDRKSAAINFLMGKADMPLPRLLVSQAEAARMIGVSRVTIYRLTVDGKLHPVSVRGARRYRVAELAKLAEGKR